TNRDSVLITNIVTQAMAKCTVRPWLSDILKSFSTMNTLQRRTVIISSYLLGDEGGHWRDHNKKGFTFIEKLYTNWGAERCKSRNIEDAL
ncbi:RNA-dependent DNA polymerase, partial [Yersinia kristensenii]|nr:RNA-dependent DNA polymerase [Yersinia kristensenii]